MPNFHPYSVRYPLPLISLGRGDETDDLNRLVNGSLAAATRFKAIEENLRNPPGPSGGWQQFPLYPAWFGWPNPAKRPLYGAFCLKMNVGQRSANNRSRAQIGFLKNGRLSKGSGVSLGRADDLLGLNGRRKDLRFPGLN
jgi:hypothetical protein